MPLLKSYNGRWPQVDPSAFLAETAVLIGNVRVGAKASIWYGCVLRGDVAPIVIGEGSNIQDGTVIHTGSPELSPTQQESPTVVGRHVTVGHMALLHACTIEDHCLIGMKACVMDGAIVEQGALVAAGAVVSPKKRVSSKTLWAGLPAKYLRDLTPDDQAWIARSATQYQELAKIYLLEQEAQTLV
jgi:gamma-carbonic anhydrase